MTGLVQHAVTADLVEQLYKSALHGELCDAVLDCVVQNLKGTPAIIFGVDTVNHAHNFLLHRGLCTEAVVLHTNNLHVGNPWLAAQWNQPVGAVYQDSDLISDADMRAWPRHKEWYGMLGTNRHATGIVIDRRDSRQLVLELHYSSTNQDRYRRRATMFFEALSPHLVLSEQIMRLHREFPVEGKMATSLLELSSLPILIIDTDNRVHNLNLRAQTMANRMETFFISAERQFHAMDLASEAAFKSALHALKTGTRKVSDIITLWNSDRSKRVFVALAKLERKTPHQAFPIQRFESGQDHIALLIHDVDEQLDLAPDVLWKAFRLSNAECELALRLLHGATIGDVAFENDVSKQTLRNQLSSIMKKTSTSRQSQLVSLLTKLAVAPLT